MGGNAAKKNAPVDGSYELVRLGDVRVEDRERASPRSALRPAAGASLAGTDEAQGGDVLARRFQTCLRVLAVRSPSCNEEPEHL